MFLDFRVESSFLKLLTGARKKGNNNFQFIREKIKKSPFSRHFPFDASSLPKRG